MLKTTKGTLPFKLNTSFQLQVCVLQYPELVSGIDSICLSSSKQVGQKWLVSSGSWWQSAVLVSLINGTWDDCHCWVTTVHISKLTSSHQVVSVRTVRHCVVAAVYACWSIYIFEHTFCFTVAKPHTTLDFTGSGLWKEHTEVLWTLSSLNAHCSRRHSKNLVAPDPGGWNKEQKECVTKPSAIQHLTLHHISKPDLLPLKKAVLKCFFKSSSMLIGQLGIWFSALVNDWKKRPASLGRFREFQTRKQPMPHHRQHNVGSNISVLARPVFHDLVTPCYPTLSNSLDSLQQSTVIPHSPFNSLMYTQHII